jgi:hypothetical protein
MNKNSLLVIAASVTVWLAFPSPAQADVVHNDDVIIEGHLCASDGNNCSNPESYPAGLVLNADIKIEDDFPAIYFNDVGGERDWEIQVDYAQNGTPSQAFSISHSAEGSTTGDADPFVIENGTGNHLLYLDSLERIGINTSTPGYTVDAVGNRIRLRTGSKSIQMRADGSETDIEAVGADLFLRSDDGGGIVRRDIVMNPYNSDGYVSIGLLTPERQLHLRGSNAVFRMDRSTNSAAFMLVRTSPANVPWKTFVVGTNAVGANNGEFVINDLGTAVSGGGSRRMTIQNNGNVVFTGTVLAPAFVPISSRRFKEQVQPLSDSLALVQQLEGVRFLWKDSGRPAVGLIAEDVAPVLPEVVERDASDGQLAGVNYSALVAVLVEAIKEQQQQLDAQEAEIAVYRAQVAGLQAKALKQEDKLVSLKTQVGKLAPTQARVALLEARLAELEALKVRLAEIEGLMADKRLQPVLVRR